MWIAGWALSGGYLPDTEPVEFEEFDDARQYVIDEITFHVEQLAEEDFEKEHEEYELALAEFGPSECGPEPRLGWFAGFTYWISQEV